MIGNKTGWKRKHVILLQAAAASRPLFAAIFFPTFLALSSSNVKRNRD
jgi:hypothetical protein